MGAPYPELRRAALGTWKYFEDPDFCTLMIRECLVRGISRFDTASSYGAGLVESNLGSAFQSLARRDEIFISSKVWVPKFFSGSELYLFLESTLSSSLINLQTSFLDCLYIHNFYDDIDYRAIVNFLESAMKARKILAFGFSHWPLDSIDKVILGSEVLQRGACYAQLLVNLITPKERYLDFWRHESVKIVAYSPLARGILTDQNRGVVNRRSRRYELAEIDILEGVISRNAALISEFVKDKDRSLTAEAYKYLFRDSRIDHVCCGFSSLGQLDALIEIVKDFQGND